MKRSGATGPAKPGIGLAVLWLCIAMACLLSAQIANRAPLLYFDSALYLDTGDNVLNKLGVPDPSAGAPAAGSQTPAPAGLSAGNEKDDDDTTSGSRSALYAASLALIDRFGGLQLVPAVQSSLFLMGLLLTASGFHRSVAQSWSPTALTALAAATAALGSAPFFAAFLMPDLFAPITIFAIAGLAGLTPTLSVGGRVGLVLLGIAGAVTHPSHLAIALVMVLPAVIAIWLGGRQRRLLATVLVLLVPLGGILEHFAFRKAVETVSKSEVVYTPFTTARLIVDGPGLVYLADRCPDPDIATCALLPLLDSPQRITPFNILFEDDPELGSLALLPTESQRRIMAEQRAFAQDVVRSYPLGVARAVLGNTLDQLLRYSFQATLVSDRTLEAMQRSVRELPDFFDSRRLAPGQPWIDPLLTVHRAVYLASSLILAGLLLLPASRLPRTVRIWGFVLIAGIVANAFVCGAVSQPAGRYGARVLFLLPMSAGLLLSLSAALRFRTRPSPRAAPRDPTFPLLRKR